MKVLKKLGVMGLVLGLTMGAVGCSNGSEDNKDDSAKKDEIVTLNVSAAASLQEAMVELEEKFKEVEPNVKLELNLGSSGSLQQQIEKEIKDLDTLATDKVEKLAIGDPESVPAGKYAKEVLDNTKLYDKVENKLVLAKDVKEVLSWVQKGSADAGFVYLSDTVGAKGIKVALTTDEDTHSTISYPIAVLKASEKQDKAKAFEDFLLSDDGQTILEKYGFKKAN